MSNNKPMPTVSVRDFLHDFRKTQMASQSILGCSSMLQQQRVESYQLDICHDSNFVLHQLPLRVHALRLPKPRSPWWWAAERRMICQKPILFLHNSKARKSKVRCKLRPALQSSDNKSHRKCQSFSLSPQPVIIGSTHVSAQRLVRPM